MKEMVKDYVLPAVRTWQGGQQTYIARKVIRTFGAGESHVESMLPDLIKRGNDPQVGITASKATISLRIEARGESPAACQEKIEPVATIVRETLGDLVFGEGGDELENAVVPLLDKSSQRLVVVEWGTAGAVSQALIKALAVSDSADDAFCGSVILSGPEAISRWLEPDVALGDTKGLAEVEDIQRTIDSLVDVAASRFQATLAVACGPLPSASMEDQDPRRNIPFLIAAKSLSDSGQQRFHRQYHVVSHPSIWLPRAKKQVLNLLRLILMGKAES